MKLFLASKSPRRKSILESLGIDFEVVEISVEEKSSEIDPVLHCKEICEQKYIAATQAGVGGKILVADTIVVSNNEILGKPKSREDAIRMLTSMSGSSHQVITGVMIGEKDGESKWLYESTEVVFFQYNQKTIERYLDHNTYQDKAGSYAIQSDHCFFVKEIKGSYTNVVGLPIEILRNELSNLINE